jgi:anhydro-N-acetylmuramic acid kinase
MEAQAFAYLAVRRLKNLPITFPTTTGVAQPLEGGRLLMA